MHFTLTVACLFCFLISLGKAAESEKIQDTQQFCLLNAYYFSVHNWGNRCDVDHMISICANVHKRLQERRCVSVLWSNTPCEQTGRNIPYPPALEILPSFLCLPVREFFFITAEILIHQKRGSFQWGGIWNEERGRKKMQYCRPTCVIPMFYDKYLMKIPTGVIEAAI